MHNCLHPPQVCDADLTASSQAQTMKRFMKNTGQSALYGSPRSLSFLDVDKRIEPIPNTCTGSNQNEGKRSGWLSEVPESRP